MPSPHDREWFRYTRRAGRVAAVPVGVKGWAALLSSIALIWSGVAGLRVATRGWGDMLFIILPPAVVVGGVLLTLRMAVRTGRRVD